MKEDLYFIGTLPEPTGGVTIYNQRKVQILSKDYNVNVVQPKFDTIFKIIFVLISNKGITYISTFNFIIVFMVVIFKFKNFYFIDHNTSRHIEGFGKIKKGFSLNFLKNAKKIILVSPHLLNNYKNFDFYENLNFKIEEAFIPPNISEKNEIIENFYPKFLKDNLSGKKLVLASASKTNLDILGQDIYSLELTLKAYDNLASKYPTLLFVMAIAEFSKDEFGNRIRLICNELQKKHKNFLFLTNNTPIWPLFEHGILFLRITTTDGDSVSLKESLFFNCPVLATDVVCRPEGTKLFNLVNDDLYEQVSQIIEEFK